MNIALYARVSTERQEKQETIRSQVDTLREYATKNNHKIIEEYIDNGWSGAIMARPALDRLRDDASKGLFQAVLIHSPDRLSRKYAYQEVVREELQKHEVQLLFLNIKVSDSPDDQLMLGMQGIIAEYEKGKIMERTRRGKLAKAKRGFVVGSQAPYGYTYVKKNEEREGYYRINKPEANIVRQIFDLFVLHSLSIRGVTKELTDKKIAPRGGSKKWGRSTIARILKNTTYIGETFYNKHYSCETINDEKKYRKSRRTGRKLRDRADWVKITVPRIINNDLFERAQQQLVQNTKLSARNVKYQYLLRGLVKCGDCGALFYCTPMHGKTYYRCSDKQHNFPLPKKCKAGSLSTNTLEPLVWSTITNALQNPQLIMEQVQRLETVNEHEKQGIQRQVETYGKQLAQIKEQEDRLLDVYGSKIITIEQLKERMSKLKLEKSDLEEKIAKHVEIISRPPKKQINKSISDYCKFISMRLKQLTFSEKQQIIRLMVNKIILKGSRVIINGSIPINRPGAGVIASTTYSWLVRPGRVKRC